MKKTRLLSLLIALFTIPTLSAQVVDISTIDRENRTLEDVMWEYKQKKHSLRKEEHKELMSTTHQVRLGIGQAWNMRANYNYIPAFNVEYSYRAIDFLEVGFTLAYNSAYTNSFIPRPGPYPDGTQTYVTRLDNNRFTFGAFVRYAWYNRKWLSIYSTVGIGIENYSETYLPHPESTERITNRYSHVVPDISLIGFRVGGRLFGYFEPLSISFRGALFSAGIGYKF